MNIRNLVDRVRLLTSRTMQLASQMCEELLLQTIIDLEKDESTITLTCDKELQESPGEGSTDVVEKEVENEKIKPQSLIVQVDESSEQFSNIVTSSPFFSQHYPVYYSIISASAIDFGITEIFEFHDKNKLGVAIAKYLEPISVRDGGASEELSSLFNCLVPSTNEWKKATSMLKNHFIYEGYHDYIEDETLK